jgi:uncharacterized membrane protein YtjA (UPF0391 family)
VIALFAALFEFIGIVTEIAKILFLIFIVIAAASLIAGPEKS